MARFARTAMTLLMLATGMLCLNIAACAAESRDHPAAGSASSPALDDLLRAFPAGLSAEQQEALIRAADPTLGRDALRQLLRDRQAATLAADAPHEMMLEFYARRLNDVAASYAGLGPAVTEVMRNPRGMPMDASPWQFVLTIAAIAAVAIAASIIVRRRLTRWLIRHERTGSPLRLRAIYLTSCIAAVAVYAGLIAFTYLILHPGNPGAPLALELLIRQGVTFWAILAAAGLILAPSAPALRLLPMEDRIAAILYRLFVTLAALTLIPSGFLLMLWGLGLSLDRALALWLPASTLPFLYLLAFMIGHRREVLPDLLQRLGVKRADGVMILIIPLAIGAYLIAVWLLVVDASLHGRASAVSRAIGSFAILIAVPLAGRMAAAGLHRFFSRSSLPLPGAAVVAHEDHLVPAPVVRAVVTTEAHVARLMRAVWIALFVIAIVAVAFLWGFSPTRMGVADYALRILANVGVVILLGYVGWALIQRWIDRRLELARFEADPGRAQRLQTLLPLFRASLRVALTVMTAMIVLSSLGIEIGPLLAGAGVVGIAIGLGAQQTIADILAGVFFLFEDSFRMGDYVEVGTTRGTVEGISLRSLKLRHQRGMLHTLPFGQIKSLTNHTRDWSLMRLEFRLPVDVDLELVRRLVKKVGQELAADPEMSEDFIQAPKSQGVRNIDGNALVIGVKYITKPGRQFIIRREAYRRILAAFQANGIAIMGSTVAVRVETADRHDPAVLGAAASTALEVEKRAAAS